VGVQHHGAVALSQEKRSSTHFTGGWVGLGDGLDWSGKYRPTGFRTPDRPARSESMCQPILQRCL